MAVTSMTNNWATAQSSSNGGLVTIFTHASSLRNPDGSIGYGGVLDRLVIYNADAIAHTVKVFRVPSSSSATVSNLIELITLQPQTPPYVYEGPIYSKGTDFYQFQTAESASSSTNPFVAVQAFYHEMS